MGQLQNVAYDFGELHKKLGLKMVKSEYIRGCPKSQSIHIWSLNFLGVKIISPITTIRIQLCSKCETFLEACFSDKT
jgi:hypothetical protein